MAFLHKMVSGSAESEFKVKNEVYTIEGNDNDKRNHEQTTTGKYQLLNN